MKSWIAIVKTTAEGRVAKYLDFATEDAAKAHAAKFGGIVAESLGRKFFDLRVVGGAVVTDSSVPFTEQKTDLGRLEERIAALERGR